MGDFPILDNLTYAYQDNIQVSAPNSNNSKGSYVQLTSSLSDNISLFYLISAYSSYNQRFLVDMAIGAAGSENIIIANIPIQAFAYNSSGVYPIHFPFRLKQGVRISFRCQSDYKNSKINMGILGLKYNTLSESFQSCDTMGTVTGSSRGTSVDPGGTADTYGSYTEIVSSTSRNYKSLLVFALPTYTSGLTCTRTVKIALGAAGSEIDIAQRCICGQNSIYDYGVHSYPWVIPFNVKSGVRISAAAKCSSTSTGRETYVSIIGLV
jgi:hypothetical protein